MDEIKTKWFQRVFFHRPSFQQTSEERKYEEDDVNDVKSRTTSIDSKYICMKFTVVVDGTLLILLTSTLALFWLSHHCRLCCNVYKTVPTYRCNSVWSGLVLFLFLPVEWIIPNSVAQIIFHRNAWIKLHDAFTVLKFLAFVNCSREKHEEKRTQPL